jgi:hypothetical protein
MSAARPSPGRRRELRSDKAPEEADGGLFGALAEGVVLERPAHQFFLSQEGASEAVDVHPRRAVRFAQLLQKSPGAGPRPASE